MNNLLFINNNLKQLKEYVQIFAYSQTSLDNVCFKGLPYINPQNRYFKTLTRDNGEKGLDLVREYEKNKM